MTNRGEWGVVIFFSVVLFVLTLVDSCHDKTHLPVGECPVGCEFKEWRERKSVCECVGGIKVQEIE